jgi:CDP-diacylglycerol--glycerol-3-phosphate 3-phosphatidyltransferase
VRAADAVAVLRAAAVIPIIWAITADQRGLALAIFLIAAASDALDGWLARRAGSLGGARGAFLDPLADKILVLGTLVALTFAPNAGWPVAVATAAICARELIVLIPRTRAMQRNDELPADVFGKAKTVLEMAGVALIVFGGRPWAVLGVIVLVPAFVLGALTIPRYFKRRLT